MATYIRSNTNIDEKNDVFNNNKDNASVPSGFVLKLYQMVNEAPDEIITVSRGSRWELRFFCHFFRVEENLISKRGAIEPLLVWYSFYVDIT